MTLPVTPAEKKPAAWKLGGVTVVLFVALLYVIEAVDATVYRGRLDQATRDSLLAKVTATPDFGALKDVQLVIEAVFENREVKAEATAHFRPETRKS